MPLRTRCSAIACICNVLAPHFREEVDKNVGNKSFGLIIDVSNDNYLPQKMMGLTARYFSKTKHDIVVSFYDLVQLRKWNAENIC